MVFDFVKTALKPTFVYSVPRRCLPAQTGLAAVRVCPDDAVLVLALEDKYDERQDWPCACARVVLSAWGVYHLNPYVLSMFVRHVL